MDIIFENSDIIGINKMPGIPAQPDLTSDISAFDEVKTYLKSKPFILNRIDRPVSGIMLFAKNKKAAISFSKAISESDIDKIYLAIVENAPPLEKDTITNYLNKKNNKTYISSDPKKGKKAILNYELIGNGKKYYYLKIVLKTGRFHQIRAQLANIGCTIKGDVKYGARRSNKDRSICLHAFKLDIMDKLSNERISLVADLPSKPLWDDLAKNIIN